MPPLSSLSWRAPLRRAATPPQDAAWNALRSAAAVATLVAASVAGPGQAAWAANCTLSTSTISFGYYDPMDNAANLTTGNVSVSCTPNHNEPLTTPYTLLIAGTGLAGDNVRSLVAGTKRLVYQVYRDPARSSVWGNGIHAPGLSSSVTSINVLGLILAGGQTHNVYARMPSRQIVSDGYYTGTLTVTVEY